jgi:hypothetical protein
MSVSSEQPSSDIDSKPGASGGKPAQQVPGGVPLSRSGNVSGKH